VPWPQVGNHWLDPGEAVYDQAVLYATHNITSLLAAGTTSVGARIGNSKCVARSPSLLAITLTTHCARSLRSGLPMCCARL
jgi:hypothetical protein